MNISILGRTIFAAIIATIVTITATAATSVASKIEAILADTYPTGGPGAAVLVYKDGKTIARTIRGYADVEKKLPLSLEQPFRLASVTKQFTALTILKLVEDGKLNLDADIRTYLPNFPDKAHTITLRTALAHTAGLTNYGNNDDFEAVWLEDHTLDKIFNWFAHTPLEFTPETNWSYSNSGYALAAKIIENTTGQSFETAIKDILLNPAGMANTHVQGKNNDYLPLDYDGEHGTIKQVQDFGIIGRGDGALHATVDDMLKWYLALKQNKLMRAQTKNIAYADNKLKNGLNTGYGLGFMLGHFGGDKSMEHGGSRLGSHAYTIMVPAQDLFVVILSNVRDGKIGTTAANIAKAALGIDGKRPPTATVASTTMQALAGQYKHGENDIRTITYKKGTLYSRRGENGGEYKLIAMANNRFYFDDEPEVQLLFEADGFLRVQYRTGMDHVGQRLAD